jgi:hypothetical protein
MGFSCTWSQLAIVGGWGWWKPTQHTSSLYCWQARPYWFLPNLCAHRVSSRIPLLYFPYPLMGEGCGYSVALGPSMGETSYQWPQLLLGSSCSLCCQSGKWMDRQMPSKVARSHCHLQDGPPVDIMGDTYSGLTPSSHVCGSSGILEH